jgi:hypothetical protein
VICGDGGHVSAEEQVVLVRTGLIATEAEATQLTFDDLGP